MQYCVTHGEKRKSRKTHKKSVIATILFFIFIFIVICCLGISKKGNLSFQEDYYFLVYAKSDTRAYVVENLQSEVKNIGGAGTIVKRDNKFFLAVNVYHSEKDAEEILKSTKKVYFGAGILKLKIKAISKNSKSAIKKDANLKALFAFLKNYLVEFEESCINYSLGEVSEGKFLSNLIKNKLSLGEFINACDGDESSEKLTKEFAQMYLSKLDEFAKNYYENQNKESLCFDLYVKIATIFADLCENL